VFPFFLNIILPVVSVIVIHWSFRPPASSTPALR
jgi:hypothetical protein